MIKLSVLVFCYNQEKTIRQTLESIISQEHEYNYELIVCDDCSKDRTPEIIKDFHSKYPNIIKPILRSQNIGLIKNFYDGITHTNGDYIMFCAGDDYWLPEKIKLQLLYMDKNETCGLTYTDSIIVNNENKIIMYNKVRTLPSFVNLIRRDHIVAGTICIRKSVFLEYIKIVKPGERSWLMEDYPLILWCSIHSKINRIPKSLFAYRLSADSVSRPSDYRHLIDFYRSEMDIRFFFDQHITPNLKIMIIKDYINRLLSVIKNFEDVNLKEYIKDNLISDLPNGISKINYNLRLRFRHYNKTAHYISNFDIILSRITNILTTRFFKSIRNNI